MLLLANVAFAQRSLKYENVVKKVSELSKEEAFGEYSDFLSLNPFIERANLYYQLAELAAAIMRDLNPLTDYPRIKNLYDASENYYLVCEQYLNDNEARKDQSLFTSVHASQRRLSAQDVSLYIRTKRGIDSLFFAEVSETFKSCASVVQAYYECMEIYKTICRNNRNINDVYIKWNINSTSLDALIAKCDSVVYFQQRFNAIDNIPDLTFTYKEIVDFKSDGISPANFKDITELWDYRSWAVRQQQFYDETVRQATSRTGILEQKLDMHIRDIHAERTPIPPVIYDDDGLIDELRNLRDIVPFYFDMERKYRIIDFLNLAYDKRNVSASNSYSVSDQADYICSLIKAYSMIQDIDNKMDDAYPTRTNLSADESIDSLYHISMENYKQYVVNSVIAGKNDHFSYNKTNIPKICGSGFYRPSSSGYIVKRILKNADGSAIAGGASVNSQGYSIAFTAFSSDGKNVNWFKTIDVSRIIYDDCTMSVCRIPGGAVSLVTSRNVSDPLLTTQTIVEYDIKGSEKQKFTLPEKNLPLGRNILHDEISGNTLLTFYGNTEEWFRDSILIVEQLSANRQTKFRSEIRLSGELINIFHSDNGRFLLFGNYVELDVLDKRETVGLGIFSLLVDADGKVIKRTVYPSDNPRYGICVNRISPKMFLISGTGGSIRKHDADLSPSEGEPAIIMTSGNGELIYDFRKN
jgi:hypothetical protein